jgi:hypothetical protein
MIMSCKTYGELAEWYRTRLLSEGHRKVGRVRSPHSPPLLSRSDRVVIVTDCKPDLTRFDSGLRLHIGVAQW